MSHGTVREFPCIRFPDRRLQSHMHDERDGSFSYSNFEFLSAKRASAGERQGDGVDTITTRVRAEHTRPTASARAFQWDNGYPKGGQRRTQQERRWFIGNPGVAGAGRSPCDTARGRPAHAD